jgi:hypothetical protein
MPIFEDPPAFPPVHRRGGRDVVGEGIQQIMDWGSLIGWGVGYGLAVGMLFLAVQLVGTLAGREFRKRYGNARVPRHDTRHTCASLLAALDVHPRVRCGSLAFPDLDDDGCLHIDVTELNRLLAKLPSEPDEKLGDPCQRA